MSSEKPIEGDDALAALKSASNLDEAISYFEQMREVMPDDRTPLEFLVAAYAQRGLMEKHQAAVVDLARLLVRDRDVATLSTIMPALEACDGVAAKVVLLKARTLMSPLPDLTPEAPKGREERAEIAAMEGIRAEVALANRLGDAGLVSPAELSALRDHLNATPTDGRVFLVSALQILEKENPTLCEKCMEHLADSCGVPPVNIAPYDIGESLLSRYPRWLVRQRGVMPFAQIGGFTLVAVLNPVDPKLKSDIEAVGPCKLFLADPAAVEAVLDKNYGAME